MKTPDFDITVRQYDVDDRIATFWQNLEKGVWSADVNVYLSDIKDYFLPNRYKDLLIDILCKTKDYYTANNLFILITKEDAYDYKQIDKILTFCLENQHTRQAFEIQHGMKYFLGKHKYKLDEDIENSIAKYFPGDGFGHFHNG